MMQPADPPVEAGERSSGRNHQLDRGLALPGLAEDAQALEFRNLAAVIFFMAEERHVSLRGLHSPAARSRRGEEQEAKGRRSHSARLASSGGKEFAWAPTCMVHITCGDGRTYGNGGSLSTPARQGAVVVRIRRRRTKADTGSTGRTGLRLPRAAARISTAAPCRGQADEPIWGWFCRVANVSHSRDPQGRSEGARMSITVLPFTEEHIPLVERFNERLGRGGSSWAFYPHPVPKWLPRQGAGAPPGRPRDDEPASVWREFFVVLDDAEGEVRGAYCLKPQLFRLQGGDAWLASWQGPVSEGTIDRRFGMVGMLCVRDMLQRNPLQFGLGGTDQIMNLLRQFGWRTTGTSSFIRVLRPRRFLREAEHLRRNRRNRMIADALLWSGTGSVILPALHAGQRLVAGGPPKAESERVERFGDWADTIWAAARDRYDMIAWRDAASLDALMGRPGGPNPELIRVHRPGRYSETIGWAALRIKRMKGDRRFGNMTLGIVLDSLALPGEEAAVTGQILRNLRHRDVDLVFTTYTSAAWQKAFRRAGFIELKNTRTFVVSPDLAERLGSVDRDTAARLHLTPIDADGPVSL